MGNAVSGRRTLLSGTAVLAAVALIALGSAPAQADETEPDLGSAASRRSPGSRRAAASDCR